MLGKGAYRVGKLFFDNSVVKSILAMSFVVKSILAMSFVVKSI